MAVSDVRSYVVIMLFHDLYDFINAPTLCASFLYCDVHIVWRGIDNHFAYDEWVH